MFKIPFHCLPKRVADHRDGEKKHRKGETDLVGDLGRVRVGAVVGHVLHEPNDRKPPFQHIECEG